MTLHDQLGHDAQTLFDRARTLDEPSEVDRARIWRSFEKAAMLGASASVAAYAGTTAAKQAGFLGVRLGMKSAWMKAGWVALAATGLAGGGYWGVASMRASGSPTAQTTEKVASVEAPAAVPSNTQEQLLAETRLLQTAQAKLTEGQPQQALAAIAEHAARFPSGLLAPERDAVRVFALCEAGRTLAARKAATEFQAAHSTSPLLAKVRNACSVAGAKR